MVWIEDRRNCTTCNPQKTGQCRIAYENGMTVNGQYKFGSIIYGKRAVSATLQFYGSADQDHMPLTRVKIDWGDNSGVLTKNGKYRNHKSVCSTATTPASVCVFNNTPNYNHTCRTDSDCIGYNSGVVSGTCQPPDSQDLKWSFGSWVGAGADEGACEVGFFQFSHAYTFSETCPNPYSTPTKKLDGPITATQSEIAKYGLAGKVGIGERFCVFKPKVQLLDNWGVCNGVDGSGKGVGYGQEYCEQKLEKGFSTPYQGFIIVKE